MPDIYLISLLSGVLCYLFLCGRPQRGDSWIVYEVVAGVSVFAIRLLRFPDDAPTAARVALLSIAAQVLGLVVTAVLYRLSPFHPLASFPGPLLARATSLYMVKMVVSGRRFRKLVELHRDYGTFVRTGPNTISINANEAVNPIYGSASAWHKSVHYFLGSLPGSGLFWIQNRDEHNIRKRHFWTPAFTSDSTAAYYPILDRRTDILLRTIKDRGEGEHNAVDISLYFQYWAHDVTGDLTFGDAYESDIITDGDPHETIKAALLQVQNFEITGEAPSLSDILWYLPVTKIFRVMDERSRRFLELRRKKGSLQPDLMTHLLNDDPDVPKLTDDDLKQEVTLAILAGTNAPSTALTFAVYFLASNPNIYDRLKRELKDAFPDYDGVYIDHQALIALPYLNAFIEEVFRLGGPVGALSRVAPVGGAVIAGKQIPEGTIVSVPPYAQMISEENFYPSPLEFKPERWLPEGLGPGTRTNRNGLLAFSHGPFGCLGKTLAYHQERVVISKLLLHYDFKLAPGFESKAFFDGIRNLRGVNFLYPLKIVLF